MNIVIVIIDTLRYDYIAANGNPDIYTPNLDRLVEKSWNFHRAFSASFPTIPHRNDVMTGRYGGPFHLWNPLNCDVPTIPRVLAEQGYCSQLIHDTPHLVNGGHNFDFPFDAWMPIRGAEVDRAWITDSWKFFDNWRFDSLFDDYPMDKEEILRKHHALCCYVQTNRKRKKEEDWNVARLFRTASEFLKDNTSREKFFLWIDCFDPHEPWDAPPEFVKMYDKTPGYDGKIDPRAFHVLNDTNLPEAARNRIKAMYKAKVTFVDKWFGLFLDTLEETGLVKNTAILLTADHGTNIGDRDGVWAGKSGFSRRKKGDNGGFGKAAPPRENESHVPFVVHVPGAGSGESNIIVQPQDIFATLMVIAGNTKLIPEEIESHDVLKLVRENSEGPRKLALGGSGVGSWRGRGSEKILFSAFDNDWRLGFAANPEKCELQRLGTFENVAKDNPDVVERMHTAAIEEIDRRGLDLALVEWLRNNGESEFPQKFRVTDANPAPKGWRGGYWNNLYNSIGLKP